jgi:hypothetical protein
MSAEQALVFDKTRQNVTLDRPNDDDYKVDTGGSDCDWTRIASLKFIKQLGSGQVQELDTGDDVIHGIQKDQHVVILGSQDTTALGQITIESRDDAIFVTAKTQIVLAVGDSRIVMKNDGTIEIVCKDFTAKATNKNTIIGQERVDINPRGTFETTEPAPPTPAPADPASHTPGIDPMGTFNGAP